MARKTGTAPAQKGVQRAGVIVSILCPPFVKWVGGKGRLLAELQNRLPKDYRERRHIEPFVGGGALYFALAPERAVLSDSNPDLVNAYMQVRADLPALSEELDWLAREHDASAYYEVREAFNEERNNPESALAVPDFRRAVQSGTALRAAVFLYLNRTCFNGLYRENKAGEFNVPVGDYENPDIRNANVLGRCAAILARPGTFLYCRDYTYTMINAGEGDFVYLDPPYDPASETSNFTAYTADGFSAEDQETLRDYVVSAVIRGAEVMLSNHDTPLIRELYKDFHIEAIEAPRSVGAKTREKAQEVIIRSYQ